MPPRSNPFQTLIRRLHDGHPGLIVRESVELVDERTGEGREVDVVVEARVTGYPITISIECTDTADPADVTWVEKMLGKHADLATDKLVLISAGGFTAQALAKARSCNAVALRLDDLGEHSWARIIGPEKELILRSLYAKSLVVAHGLEGISGGYTLSGTDKLARDPLRVSAAQLIDTVLSKEKLLLAALEVAASSEGKGCVIELPLKPGVILVRSGKEPTEVEALSMVFLPAVTDQRMAIRTGRFQGTPVAFGGIRSKDGEVDLSVFESADGSLKAVVTDRQKGQAPTVRPLGGIIFSLCPMSDAEMKTLLHGP